jgi:hypothetical protein
MTIFLGEMMNLRIIDGSATNLKMKGKDSQALVATNTDSFTNVFYQSLKISIQLLFKLNPTNMVALQVDLCVFCEYTYRWGMNAVYYIICLQKLMQKNFLKTCLKDFNSIILIQNM